MRLARVELPIDVVVWLIGEILGWKYLVVVLNFSKNDPTIRSGVKNKLFLKAWQNSQRRIPKF